MKHPVINSRPVIFGEVLFDCFPDGSRVLGGAPFNVAWHCQAFGLQPVFISRLGNDALGREVHDAMLDWGMDDAGIQFDAEHPTGIVDVSFNDGEPAYDIVENSAWDFIDPQQLPAIDSQSVLYHGSLALRNQLSSSCLQHLQQQCASSVFIDVNLRPPWWELPLIDKMIQHGRWIKLNADELSLIIPQQKDTFARAEHLLAHLPDVDLIVVTQGDAGAMAISRHESCFVEPDRSINVVDTVGAGDAFSSVLLLGIHKAWPLQTILNRAQQFASAVVEQRGATTRNKLFYSPFIESWQL